MQQLQLTREEQHKHTHTKMDLIHIAQLPHILSLQTLFILSILRTTFITFLKRHTPQKVLLINLHPYRMFQYIENAHILKPCSQHRCVSCIRIFQKHKTFPIFKSSEPFNIHIQKFPIFRSSEPPNVQKFRTSQYSDHKLPISKCSYLPNIQNFTIFRHSQYSEV